MKRSAWFQMMEKRRATAEAAGLQAGLASRGAAANPYVGKGWSEGMKEAWTRGWRKGRRQAAAGQQGELLGG